MAAMIISVGFSVDIPAHVSYHYHSAGFHGEVGVKERLRATLASVGFPAVQVRLLGIGPPIFLHNPLNVGLQASLSTNLCVLSLLFVPLYMAHVSVE